MPGGAGNFSGVSSWLSEILDKLAGSDDTIPEVLAIGMDFKSNSTTHLHTLYRSLNRYLFLTMGVADDEFRLYMVAGNGVCGWADGGLQNSTSKADGGSGSDTDDDDSGESDRPVASWPPGTVSGSQKVGIARLVGGVSVVAAVLGFLM